jgi:uncharacterized membrane protein YedE/YeeE
MAGQSVTMNPSSGTYSLHQSSTPGDLGVNLFPVWVSFGAWILLVLLSVAIVRIILEKLSTSRFSQSAKRALYVAVVLLTSGMIGVAYLLPNAAIDFSQVEEQNLRPSLLATWIVYGGLALFVGGLLLGLGAFLVHWASGVQQRKRTLPKN